MLSPLQTSLHGISLYLPLQGMKAHTPLQLESWPPFWVGASILGTLLTGLSYSIGKGWQQGGRPPLGCSPQLHCIQALVPSDLNSTSSCDCTVSSQESLLPKGPAQVGTHHCPPWPCLPLLEISSLLSSAWPCWVLLTLSPTLSDLLLLHSHPYSGISQCNIPGPDNHPS